VRLVEIFPIDEDHAQHGLEGDRPDQGGIEMDLGRRWQLISLIVTYIQ
jgi:hypothetical protein